MRSLPMLLRLADEMKRMTMAPFPSAFTSAFFEDPWAAYRSNAWKRMARWENEHFAPKIGKHGYQVSIDVGNFQPNELTVKSVDNHTVVIEGKTEESDGEATAAGGNGYLSCHFVRKFVLPQGYDATKAIPTLSSDGVLTVSVPNPPELADTANERVLPIQQTGPAHMNIKNNGNEEQQQQQQASGGNAKK